MRDYKSETEKRIAFIRGILNESKASGIIFGNSGGKDSALVGILSKMACDSTLGIMMPCQSKRNFAEDMKDASDLAVKYGISCRVVDLSELKAMAVRIFGEKTTLSDNAVSNIAPRLRMLALYTIGAAENRLVAGTGNRSEIYMGYFTKWGDGACDFNPIADLTATEVVEYLEYLDAPKNIRKKAPSAGLFEGQTDEDEMGITYEAIDNYLLNGIVSRENLRIIENYHKKGEHKRRKPKSFGD
ncbi:MAG TPA: NAD(+) synthase [Clostridiales bacterium]|nr:NAD(+) synthase [Eubacteriales bacterium]HBR30799.1 NAD(+) synthase [Clostridiales bacterium]